MGYPKRLSLYPMDLYFELIERATKEPLRIPCKTAQDARAFQSNFYNFRLLLRKEGHTEMADKADFLAARISSDNPTTIIIGPRDQMSRDAQILRAFLRNEHE